MDAARLLARHGVLVALATLMALPQRVEAHWCSNIFASPSRLVVRPERDTVYIDSGSPTTLRVYVRNNFPYRLDNVQMRGDASGYSVAVSPSSQTTHPRQDVVYVLTISSAGGPTGNVPVTNLDLQVRFRFGGWQDSAGCYVDQDPSDPLLRDAMRWDYRNSVCNLTSQGVQASSLAAATWADQHPSSEIGSQSPFFGRTGIQQLIHWFGYRFCYNTNGTYRCLDQDCPSSCAEGSAWTSTVQFPQNCMRAGTELAIRRSALSSADATAARQAAINAFTPGGSNEHKCIAAIVGAHLWRGQSSTTAFTDALTSGSNSVPTRCQNAGRRVLDGSNGSNCTSGQFYELAACAAAEGLRDNDGPVTSVLLPNAGDGTTGASGYPGLYYSYLLSLVVADREQRVGSVSFYPTLVDCDSVTECTGGDGCCPASCHANNDGDCDPVCDNGELESGETCEPRSSCPTTCVDTDACTRDVLSGSASTCTSTCTHPPITQCANGDGCCASGCNANNDNDCDPVCNNGVRETGETCDPRSSCPTECDDGNPCTTEVFSGSASDCTALCTPSATTQCADDDGCCPAGCDHDSDNDCSSTCNDGHIDEDQGETCDPRSTCPTSCTPPDECTTATLTGSATNCNAACVNSPITQCTGGDGCCPAGCFHAVDSDCTAPVDPDGGSVDASTDAGVVDAAGVTDQGTVDAASDAGAVVDGRPAGEGGVAKYFRLGGGCALEPDAQSGAVPGLVVLALLLAAAAFVRRRG